MQGVTNEHINAGNLRVCRICLQSDEQMLVPCKCRGTVNYVGQNCLRIWLQKCLEKNQCKKENSQLRYLNCEMCTQKIYFSVNWKWERKSLSEVALHYWDNIWITSIRIILFLITIFILVFAYNRPFQESSNPSDITLNTVMFFVFLVIAVLNGFILIVDLLLVIFIRVFWIDTIYSHHENTKPQSEKYQKNHNFLASTTKDLDKSIHNSFQNNYDKTDRKLNS